MKVFVGGMIGLVTAMVATALGFNFMQWQWWGIFALAEVLWILGLVIGGKR